MSALPEIEPFLSSFHRDGIALARADSLEPLHEIRRLVAAEARRFGCAVEDIDGLRKSIAGLSHTDLNRLKARAIEPASELIAQAFRSTVVALCGRSVFLQRRPNISCNVPGRPGTVTRSHTDMLMGHSPFTCTFWLPLHDIIDDSGLAWLTQDASRRFLERHDAFRSAYSEEDFWAAAEDRIDIAFGQALVFNGFILHGARPNRSGLARLALDVRFQDRSKPLYQKNFEYFRRADL